MPIYEYYCPSCESRFEVLRPMSRSREAASCPHCQGEARRMLSIFASFSKGEDGSTTALAGTGPACGSCAGGSCSTCF